MERSDFCVALFFYTVLLLHKSPEHGKKIRSIVTIKRRPYAKVGRVERMVVLSVLVCSGSLDRSTHLATLLLQNEAFVSPIVMKALRGIVGGVMMGWESPLYRVSPVYSTFGN